MTHKKSAITIDDLGKRYLLGSGGGERYRALRDVIVNGITGLFKRDRSQQEQKEFWALRNVSLRVEEGKSFGVIGRNGAGKSTLLKLISQITEPTEGEIRLRGRVASLLEVGTGFHPELTGRENIFMNGSIMGMTNAEIKRKFDEIVDFAEIAKFLDTPVKRYSSGMYVRLAFAVAAHLETEILLIDEVLAVGDAKFQKKCLSKMENVSASGKTIMFVSHNMASVKNLCSKCIWLDSGRVKMIDDADKVIDSYLLAGEEMGAQKVWNDQDAPQNSWVKMRSVRLLNESEEPAANFKTSEPVLIELVFEVADDGNRIVTGYHMFRRGTFLFSASDQDHNEEKNIRYGKGVHKVVCVVPANLLNYGEHNLEFVIGVNNAQIKTGEVLSFRVFNDYPTEWLGEVRPKLEWRI